MTEPLHLRKCWHDLLLPFPSPVEEARQVFADLLMRYSSLERHYHTLTHLAAMLRLLPEASPSLALAVWFHDAVYDTHSADNEERSAALADEKLPALFIPAELRAEIRRLILLTKRHETTAADADGCRLLDADLAILGAPADEYDLYARAIRREYAWVAEEDYRRGRRQVLEKFLQRKVIYFTETMQERCEAAARENLQREIDLLG